MASAASTTKGRAGAAAGLGTLSEEKRRERCATLAQHERCDWHCCRTLYFDGLKDRPSRLLSRYVVVVVVVVVVVFTLTLIIKSVVTGQASIFYFLLFFFFTLVLSIFWTSRGHRCRPFSPPVHVFNFYRA